MFTRLIKTNPIPAVHYTIAVIAVANSAVALIASRARLVNRVNPMTKNHVSY